jgi:hypothetical protein
MSMKRLLIYSAAAALVFSDEQSPILPIAVSPGDKGGN